MGRRRAFDPDEVLDRAMRAFWRRGYEATSIDDLVLAAGINRASLYGAFGDKAALFRACLEHYAREVVGPSLAALAEQSPDAAQRFLMAVAAYAASDPKRQGCLMVNTAVETRAHSTDVVALVRDHVARLESSFENTMEGREASARARLALCVSVGLLVLGKIGVERGVLEDAVRAAFA